MVIYIAMAFIFTGGISIFSLCKAAGRADQLEEEMLVRKNNMEYNDEV